MAAKKIAQPKIVTAEVLPGWVHIRKVKNHIEYKYGDIVYKSTADIERQAAILGDLLFKYRLEKEQYEHDMDVLRLGDMSEYYNKPTLAEQHYEDMAAFNRKENESESDY